MFLHSGLRDNFTFLKFILIELKIIIWLSKPFFNPKIDFKTSLACSDPKIPATGEKIPSVSQFFSKTKSNKSLLESKIRK